VRNVYGVAKQAEKEEYEEVLWWEDEVGPVFGLRKNDA
jgi:hypothetical protein